jgi:hypothetical protein
MKQNTAPPKHPKLAKIFLLAGTVLLWLPVLFTLITAAIGSIAERSFIVDYLMPAELFPVAALGSILLIIGTYLARKQYIRICITTLLMGACLAAGQLTAVLTGMASGERAAEGSIFIIVVALIVAYSLLLLVNCVAGLIITKKLLKRTAA